MKNVLILLIGSVLLITCGGDQADIALGSFRPKVPVVNPWKNVGEGTLPQEPTDDVRMLDFGDGMRIIYDSTVPGDQEICREEVVGEHKYLVCMSLDEEVLLETSSVLWPFLMLESYNGRITCGIDDIYSACDTEVFPALGGDENFCRAGVINGDKALLCEDDWAVVANGVDGQKKTVCRVHIGTGTGRCLGAPKTRAVDDGSGGEEPVPAEELILEMQQSSWGGYRSENINSLQVLDGDSLEAEVVLKMPLDARLAYKSADESVCTVDNDGSDGDLGSLTILSGVAPDTCEISLTITAPDFVDRVILAEVAVVQENNTAWTGYDPNPVFYVGEKRSIRSPTGMPASATLAYRTQDETICIVDEDTGEVTGVAGGDCVVVLNSSKEEFLEIEIESDPLTVTPGQSFNSFAWADFPASAVVGTDINFSSKMPVSDPVADAYEISIVSGDCTWDNSGKVLSFQDATACMVRAIARKRGYEPATLDRTLTPAAGTLAITWTPATVGAVGVELVLDAVSGVLASAEIAYTVKNAGTTGCAFKGTGGADVRTLTFSSVGTCTVTASVSLTGYRDWTSPDHAITVAAGALGNVTWGNFSGTLVVGGGRKAPSAPTGSGANGAIILYKLKSGSDTNCELTNANTGEVTAKAVDLTTTKTCTVVGTASKNGRIATEEISVGLSPGTLGDITWGTFAGTLQVGGSAKAPTAASGAGTSGATVSYELKSGSETNCVLTNANTGEVQAKAVDLSGTQTCTIVGSFTRIGYTTKTGEISINLSAGTMGDLTDPAYAGTLAVMGTLIVTTPPSGAPDGAGWSYTVAGERSGSSQSNICDIDGETGAVSATGTAVAGDVCIVTATASATGYADKSASAVRLTVSAQEALTITWSGYTPASLTWASGGVSAPTLNTVSVTDTDNNAVDGGTTRTYSVGSGTTNNSCTVVSGTGSLTIAGAGTCEVILTVVDSDSDNEESYATQTKKATVTIGKAAQNIVVAANPYGASPSLNVGGGDLRLANTPTGGQSALALEYQSLETAVCTVGSATGTVSPVTIGTCTIQARRVGDANFNPSDWEDMIELEVGRGTFTSLSRGTLPTTGTVGVNIDLSSSQPVSIPEADSYTITTTSADCSYSGTTLSFTGTTECVLSVTVTKTGYTSKTEIFRITVGAGALGSITWGSFTGDLVVGESGKIPTAASGAGISGATVSYELKSGSETNCVLTNANTGEVTAKAVDLTTTKTCTIVGTASKDGYTPTTGEIFINLAAGTMGALTPPAYVGSLAVGGTLSVTTQPDGAPDGVSWSYTVAGERSGSSQDGICDINPSTGAVSATGSADEEDFCIVTARASATGYTSKDAPVRRLEVFAREALTITWTGYTPASLTWMARGVTAPRITTVRVEDSDSNVVESGISYTYSLGSGTTNNSCTVVSSSGALTINGAGTCEVVLTIADSDGDNEESYATTTDSATVTIAKGSQTIVAADNPYGTSPSLNVGGGDLSVTNAPTGGQSTLVLEYQSLDTDVCTVNSGDGTIFPVTTGTCTIQVRRRGGTNFNPSGWVEMIELEVGPGTFASLTWDTFPSSATVGTDISMSGKLPVSSPVGEYSVAIISGSCAYDPTAQTLSFTNTDLCTVEVTASKDHYDDITATFTVRPGEGTLNFDTVPTLSYSGNLRHGDRTTPLTPAALPASDSNGVAVTWSHQVSGFESNGSTSKADVCVVSGGNVQLGTAGVEGDVCRISVTGEATGYSDYTGVAAITKTVQKGVITGVSWSPQTTGTVGTDLTLTAVVGNLGSDTVTYTKVRGSCSLSGRVLTFSASGSCVVKATVARNHYTTWDSGEKSLTVSEGTIAFATPPTLSYSGGSLRYGDTTTVLTPTGLSGDDDNSVAITWHYQLQGKNGGTNANKANVCVRADTNLGHGNYNKVKLGSAAMAGDICRVSVTGRATGYADYTAVTAVDLTVGLGVQSAPSGWSNHYGSSSQVNVGETLPVSGTAPVNSASGGGALEYAAKSGGTHCSVNSSSGEVRGNSVGSCVIQARFVAVANKYANSPWSDVATITVQTGSQAYTWSQGAATATFGNELALAELTGTPAGATISYQIVDGANSAGCAWKGSSGVNLRTLTFSDDGSCMVRVEVTRIGYNAWSSPSVTITVSPASWTTAPAWAGYTGSATFNAAAPSLSGPTSTPSATWTYATSTGTVCGVNENTGALSIATAGDCTVTATPDKAGYGTHSGISRTVAIAKANQNAPSGWGNPYGSNPSLAVGAAALGRSGSVPSGQGNLEYRVLSTHGANCQVVGSTGAVTAKDAGAGNSCTIQARFGGNGNYNPSTYSSVATISIVAGSIALTWNGYSPFLLTWSESLSAPTAQDVNVTPTDAGLTYTSRTAAVCTVASAADPTLTILKAGTCTVRVRAAKTGYTSVNTDRTVTIDKAANPGSTTTVDAYAATVAVGTPIDPSGLPSDGQGGLKYRVRNQAGTTGGSDSTHCSVRTSDGQVSATAAAGSVGQTCYVQARWKSNDNYNSSAWFNIAGQDGIDVEAGTITLTWGAGYGNTTWYSGLESIPWTLAPGRFSVAPSDASVTYTNRTPLVCTVASSTDPTLSLLKAGTCRVRARATKPGYTTVTADETFVINQGANPGTTTTVDVYADSVAVGSPIDPSGLPTNGQGGLEYRVWNQAGISGGAASSHCNVEQASGRVSGVAAGTGQTCHIHARWKGNDNFRASGWFKISGNGGITVGSGSQSYSWSQSAATATFGNTATLVELTGPPAGSTITYRIASGANSAGCSLSGRTLSFSDDGSCRVEVRVTRTGYTPWTSPAVTITVSPASWTTAPAWSGYAAGATFNAAAPDITAPTSTPSATWTYATSTGTICRVNQDSGALTILAAGDCIVTATPAKAGYGTHAGISQTIAIAKADQSAPSGWSDPYGASPSLAVGADPLTLSGATPSGQGALSYRILAAHDANCTIVTGTGAVTATVAGVGNSCTIQAQFVGNGNYNPSGFSTVDTISIVAGSIALTWNNGYGTSLTWDEDVPTETFDPLESVRVTPPDSQISYSNRTPLICTVASATDPTLTILKAGECTVRVSATKPGYTADQIDTILLVSKAANPGTITAMDAYANSVAVGSPITPTGLPTNGKGGLEYRVWNQAATSGGSASSHCVVEQTNGRLSGTAGSTGQTCWVHARWKGNDNYRASGHFNISGSSGINVVLGSQSYSWGQSAASVTFGATLTLAELTGPPQGSTITYSLATGSNSAVCTLNGRILSFANDGSCRVKTGVTRTGYNPWMSPAVTITVNPAPWTAAPAWTGYSAAATFNTAAPAITLPTSTPAATWTYASTTDAVCDVNNSGVLTIVKAGSCSITATPSLAGYGTRNHAGITQTFTIAKAAQNAPSGWSNPYGSSPTVTVGGDDLALDTGSTAPTGQGTLEYQIKTGSTSYCSVAGDGAVSPIAAGSCVIQARFAGNTNYRPSDYSDIATITVSAASLPPLDTLSVSTLPTYSEGSNLYEGAGNKVTVVSPPVVTDSNGNVMRQHDTIVPRYTVVNARNCRVGYETGTVEVKEAARDGDTCDVTVTVYLNGYTRPVIANVPFTLQPAITFAQLNTRILNNSETSSGDRCITCHGGWTSNVILRSNASRLNLDPTRANLWKRVQKAHDWNNNNLGNIMPQTCSQTNGVNNDSCLSVVDVEYVASFLRGGSWQPEQSISAPMYTEGTNLFEGSGNEVWIVTAPVAKESGTSTTISATIRYSAVGKRGSVARANICSIHGISGRVTVGSAALAGDTCEITITSTASGYLTGTTTHTLTVQSPITYSQIASRFLTSRCLSCHANHGSWTDNAALRSNAVRLNTNPTQATIWKRVKRAYLETDNSSYGDFMPTNCNRTTGINNCLSEKDVEYLASFLRGGDWQFLMNVTPPVYSEGSNLYVGSGNQVWVATAPRAADRSNPNFYFSDSRVTFTYSAQGVREGAITSNICSINSSDGRVTVGSAAVANDTCEITVTANSGGYPQDVSTTRVILTVQPVVTLGDVKSRFMTSSCMGCHGSGNSNGDFSTLGSMRNISGLLNTTPVNASLWKRIARVHLDTDDSSYGDFMPTSCNRSSTGTCVSEKNVEYLASFLRGGDWEE